MDVSFSMVSRYHLAGHVSKLSPMTKQQLKQLQKQEEKRKQNHSLVEKKRRQRMDTQIQQLKKLVPCLVIRDEQEKLAILKSTTEYIEKLQSVLKDIAEKEPTLQAQVEKLLPQKNHSIFTLLPNYKPLATADVSAQKSEVEQKKPMSLDNLLC